MKEDANADGDYKPGRSGVTIPLRGSVIEGLREIYTLLGNCYESSESLDELFKNLESVGWTASEAVWENRGQKRVYRNRNKSVPTSESEQFRVTVSVDDTGKLSIMMRTWWR